MHGLRGRTLFFVQERTPKPRTHAQRYLPAVIKTLCDARIVHFLVNDALPVDLNENRSGSRNDIANDRARTSPLVGILARGAGTAYPPLVGETSDLSALALVLSLAWMSDDNAGSMPCLGGLAEPPNLGLIQTDSRRVKEIDN